MLLNERVSRMIKRNFVVSVLLRRVIWHQINRLCLKLEMVGNNMTALL